MPKHLPVEQLPFDAKELRRAFDDALVGKVAGARMLRTAWYQVADDMIESLERCAGINVQSITVTSRFVTLPLLDAAHHNLPAALYDWALIGIREQIAAPVSYVTHPRIDNTSLLLFMRAATSAAFDEMAPVTRIKKIFGVANADVAHWLGVSASAVGQYERGESSPRAGVADRLGRITRLADVFVETVRDDAISAVFAHRPVPLLAGATYQHKLEQAYDVDVLIDIVRRASGRQPETEAGARYLSSERAARAIARHEQWRETSEHEKEHSVA